MPDDWTYDVYRGRCQNAGPPKPGYFRIRLARRGPWVPAEIREELPIDPLTGEVMDRSFPIQGYINGEPADYQRVWAWGRRIEKEEFKWLEAVTALKN